MRSFPWGFLKVGSKEILDTVFSEYICFILFDLDHLFRIALLRTIAAPGNGYQ